MKNPSKIGGVSLAFWLVLGGLAGAQEKAAAVVQGIKGVKEEAVSAVKNVEKGSATPAVNKIDGVPADGRATAVPIQAVAAPVITGGGSIQAVHGVSGIQTPRIQNLEAALNLKEAAPPITDKGGKGKAAAAALLGPPLGKPEPKTGPKEDGRAGFQEFEKFQNTGS
jgi:hypothetical protein